MFPSFQFTARKTKLTKPINDYFSDELLQVAREAIQEEELTRKSLED